MSDGEHPAADHDEGRAAPPRASTATKPGAAPARVESLPPFRVLLHNDDQNPMDFVVDSLVEITPLSRSASLRVMLEAHTRGVALVLTAHLERAELYRDRLVSKGLSATVERAD